MEAAESSANFNIKICDKKGNCCQTKNIGQPREKGKIDVFAKLSLLGSCSQRVITFQSISNTYPYKVHWFYHWFEIDDLGTAFHDVWLERNNLVFFA